MSKLLKAGDRVMTKDGWHDVACDQVTMPEYVWAALDGDLPNARWIAMANVLAVVRVGSRPVKLRLQDALAESLRERRARLALPSGAAMPRCERGKHVWCGDPNSHMAGRCEVCGHSYHEGILQGWA